MLDEVDKLGRNSVARGFERNCLHTLNECVARDSEKLLLQLRQILRVTRASLLEIWRASLLEIWRASLLGISRASLLEIWRASLLEIWRDTFAEFLTTHT